MLKVNHEAVQDYVNTELTFDPEGLDEQLAVMEKWMDNRFLYPEDYGLVYERASNIYKFREDYANYARSFGNAMYYLEQSSDVDYMVNLELDLAMFYTVNNNYKLAGYVVDRMLAEIDTDRLQSIQIKSYLHRFQGVLAIHEGDYDKAEEHILLAEEIIKAEPDGLYTPSYHAINMVNLAQIRFYQGKYDEAQTILDEFKDSDLFESPVYASIMARDFILPYLETEICLALERGEDFHPILRSYIEECEEFGYNQWELQMILSVSEKLGRADSEGDRELSDMLEKAYEYSAKTQGTSYTNLLNGIMKDSYAHTKETHELEKYTQTRVFIYIMIVVALVWIGMFVFFMIKSSKLDGLTGVGSRGAFNAEMNRNKRPYGIIMMDIDNFKTVNDTYGHQKGDEVLQRLGQILMDMNGSYIHPYRYGGEEFVLVIYDRPLPLVANIAEHVRKIFEAQEWDFGANITLSLGCAVSEDGDDVVKRADDNLYISKKNGKNRVTS
jgi:diguanylate cyclase (GGDEF)-like protein